MKDKFRHSEYGTMSVDTSKKVGDQVTVVTTQDWELCRLAGLKVNVHKVFGGDHLEAWIRAEDVEKLLKNLKNASYGPDLSGDDPSSWA